jgi:hypothetical protein
VSATPYRIQLYAAGEWQSVPIYDDAVYDNTVRAIHRPGGATQSRRARHIELTAAVPLGG